MPNANLVGRSFDIDLGTFIPRLTFLDAKNLRVQAAIGSTVVDEVVQMAVRQAVR